MFAWPSENDLKKPVCLSLALLLASALHLFLTLHGSVLTRLTLQHWMGAEQHPMTIVVATDMLVNHKADDADRKNNEQQGTSDQAKGDNVVSTMTDVETSFAQ